MEERWTSPRTRAEKTQTTDPSGACPTSHPRVIRKRTWRGEGAVTCGGQIIRSIPAQHDGPIQVPAAFAEDWSDQCGPRDFVLDVRCPRTVSEAIWHRKLRHRTGSAPVVNKQPMRRKAPATGFVAGDSERRIARCGSSMTRYLAIRGAEGIEGVDALLIAQVPAFSSAVVATVVCHQRCGVLRCRFPWRMQQN